MGLLYQSCLTFLLTSNGLMGIRLVINIKIVLDNNKINIYISKWKHFSISLLQTYDCLFSM